MTAMQRNKGQSCERAAAELVRELTGWDVRRQVRQHAGDSDLQGVPGWSVEVKRQRTAAAGEIAAWWRQAVGQAERAGGMPVLLYRADRAPWRARWPLATLATLPVGASDLAVEWTTDTTVQAWAAVALRGADRGAGASGPAKPASGPGNGLPGPLLVNGEGTGRHSSREAPAGAGFDGNPRCQ